MQEIHPAPRVRSVGLVSIDYVGLRPKLEVAIGDTVRLGQPLFSDGNNPDAIYVSPGAGEVTAVNMVGGRQLQSVVIALDEDDDEHSQETFNAYRPETLHDLNRSQVAENLLASGLWVGLRSRPFSKTPAPESEPAAIFVTAIDSNPLTTDPRIVIDEHPDDFRNGVLVLTKLASKVYVCERPQAGFPKPADPAVVTAEFAGPHPAGLAGTHIHLIEPVGSKKSVWHIGYQDVIAVGKLFTTGRIWVERVISLAGPVVSHPRLLRTRLGASIDDLLTGELPAIECRIVSGSVLAGRRAAAATAFLGRYHNQVAVLAEGRDREFLGWILPGRNKLSTANISMFRLRRHDKKPSLNTSQHGSPRALIPLEIYEAVMPMRILPTPLLRSLLVMDAAMAEKLGCLELDEEDLALCSFVCPSKHDYGPALRANLDIIEKDAL